MKAIKKIIVFVLVVALLGFTAFFLVSSYNSGKIGHKAEKVAGNFETDIIGTWDGAYSISSLTFMDEGKTGITMLGITLDGTYSDDYNLESETHTLTLKYNSSLGISVTRSFIASINEDKTELTLVDTQAQSIKMTYTKHDENAVTQAESATTSANKETTVYNPGIDVFKSSVIGKWTSDKGSNSGYEFVDSSKVTVTLLGVSYDGTYSVSVEESTNKYVVKINYISVAGVNISNSYYVTIEENSMTLVQKGAESFSTTYTKA